jgi:hypothetical protein
MIGSFDSLTISRLGESSGAAAEAVLGEDGAGVATGGWLACSVGFSFEHPARMVPAEATSAAYPNSLRLSLAEAGLLLGAGAQVPHPVVLHVPHPLAEALITLSESPIAFPPLSGHYSPLYEQRQGQPMQLLSIWRTTQGQHLRYPP